MRQAIGEPHPGPKVLAGDVPYRAEVIEGHQCYRVDEPVHRLGGVYRVERGGVEGVVQPRVHGQIVRRLPVVLEVKKHTPLMGIGAWIALRRDDLGRNPQHQIRPVETAFIGGRIGAVVGGL